jgi:hypothetical protein
MKVIDNISKNYSLAEIGHGKITSQFALFNSETEEIITPFVICKDFLGDVFWSNKIKKPGNIYGFKWEPNEDKGILEKEHLFIVLRKVNENKVVEPVTQFEAEAIGILLNKFDSANEFYPTETVLCEEGKNVIVKFDKKWTEIPYLWSAFLLLLRIGFKYDKVSDVQDHYKNEKNYLSMNDIMYMRTAKGLIKDLEEGFIDRTQTYEQYVHIGNIHSGSGVVSWTPSYKRHEQKVVVAETVS